MRTTTKTTKRTRGRKPVQPIVRAVYDEGELPNNVTPGLAFQPRETNRRLLNEAWAVAGLRPRYPVQTVDAVHLLRHMGYQPSDGRLSYIFQRGYARAPEKKGGMFAWNASDIVAVADALESLRAWHPLSHVHDHKRRPDELEQVNQHRRLIGETLASLRKQDIPTLAAMMLDSGRSDEERELIAIVLGEMTGSIHIRGDERTDAPPEDN